MFKLSPSFLNNKLHALVEWISDEEFYNFHVQLDAICCLNHPVWWGNLNFYPSVFCVCACCAAYRLKTSIHSGLH